MLTEPIVQLLIMVVIAGMYAAAFVLGLRHMRRGSDDAEGAAGVATAASMGWGARVMVALATAVGIGVLAWRACLARTPTLLLSNHFDAFLVLAVLLVTVLMYFRWTRNLQALSFFMLPMIVVMLLLGGALAVLSPGEYPYQSVWTRVHITAVVSGTLCFAMACVGGIVYLLADRQLKRKGLDSTHRWIGLPPLASMEKFNQRIVYLGFPLLTVVMFTGVLRMVQGAWHGQQVAPKVVMAGLAWVIYAGILHLPLAPSFRGKRAAWLSIVGFGFFIGGYVAANWAK